MATNNKVMETENVKTTEVPVKAKVVKKRKKALPKLTCKNCGDIFTTVSPYRKKSKMCSKSCASIFSNKNRVWSIQSRRRASIAKTESGVFAGPNNPKYNGGGVSFSCHCCLKSFTIAYNEVKAGKKKGFYCSSTCYKISVAAKSKASEKLARCTPMYAAAMAEIKRLEGIIDQVHDVSGIIISNLNDQIEVPQTISQIFSLTDLKEPS
jgi:hypothetical protein